MTTPLLALLQRAVALEAHSFLLYVRDAGEARVAPHAADIKRALDECVRHEEAYLNQVLSLVERAGGKPDYAFAYDMESAGYHYLELTYLIQVVADKLARQLAAFRTLGLEAKNLDAHAASVLADIARKKETDLAQIESLLGRVRQKQGTAAVENNVTVRRR